MTLLWALAACQCQCVDRCLLVPLYNTHDTVTYLHTTKAKETNSFCKVIPCHVAMSYNF